MAKQLTIFKTKRKPAEVPRWTRPGTWQPAPGEPTVFAQDLSEMCRRAASAGLHVMRMTVIEKPCQGYRLLIVGGGYMIAPALQKPQAKAVAGGFEMPKLAAAEPEDDVPWSWE